MAAYLIRRLLLMIPTILGIMLISFTIVQFAPGGPVERVLAQLQGQNTAMSRITGGGGDLAGRGGSSTGGGGESNSRYRGAQGLDPAFIKRLEQQFGFDKPAPERFVKMLWDYARFDFGKSYFRDVSVLQLIREKLPVSISLGLWMTLISYAISMIPEWEKAVERSLLSLAPGGSLHIVDFGQQEHLPVWFRSLLQAWLTKFHVTPRANLRYVLETLAGSHNASLEFDPIARGYAWRAVLTMPKS